MKNLLAVAAIVLSAGSALAADLPSRKGPPALPPPPPPPPMWTGFYAGLNAGYGFGTNNATNSVAWNYGSWNLSDNRNPARVYYRAPYSAAVVGTSGQTQSGFVGGGQFGYNYQWGSNLLLGFEADIQGSGVRGGSSAPGVFSTTSSSLNADGNNFVGTADFAGSAVTRVSAGLDYIGTARGRLGYLLTPTLLVYGTGGLAYGGAWANISTAAYSSLYSITDFNKHYGNLVPGGVPGFSQTYVGGGSRNSLLVGYSAGGGVEWMFMPNWSLKAEALYYNLGNMTVTTAAVAASSIGAFSDRKVTNGVYRGATDPAFLVGSTRVNYQGVVARAGVNYHFNWFAPVPVVAKY